MPKALRVILMVFFWIAVIAAFMLVAIILVFMAAGYRYNTKSGEVQRTGMIYLKSDPRTAQVYLNDELKSVKTPTRLLYLIPQNYQVKLTKTGYLDWEKNIIVKSEEVSSFDRIILFLKDRERKLLQKDVSSYLLAPNKRYLTWIDKSKKKIYFLDIKTNHQRPLYSSSNTLKLSAWSNNSLKILIKDHGKGDVVLDTRNPSATNFVTKNTMMNFSQLTWNPANNNYLFGFSKNTIYQIDLLKNTSKAIRSNVALFTCSNYEIFYLYTKKDIERFVKSDFQGKNPQFLTPPLTFSIKNIFVSKNGRIAVIDQENNLYLKNNSENSLLKIKDIVLSASWGRGTGIIENLFGEEKLVYFGLNEIGGYFQKRDPRFQDETNNFITRLSKQIQKVLWYDDFEHIAYLAGNSVHIVELDGGNDTVLSDKVKDFDLINDGKTLLVLNDKGLNLIKIRK